MFKENVKKPISFKLERQYSIGSDVYNDVLVIKYEDGTKEERGFYYSPPEFLDLDIEYKVVSE